MSNPALDALFAPQNAAASAVERLKLSATSLTTEGMRGKDLTLNEWVTIVDIQRVPPTTPAPGRMAPLLRAGGRVASRASTIIQQALEEQQITSGRAEALETAAQFSRAAFMACNALAQDRLGTTDVSAFKPLFTGMDAQIWAGLFRRVMADVILIRREFMANILPIDWQMDASIVPIRCNSDGQSAINVLLNDFTLHYPSWDIYTLAERLAAGMEVTA